MLKRQRLILVGAGHAHLYLAMQAGAFLDARLSPVLIEPGSFWYPGFAAGMLSGAHNASQVRVEPHTIMEAQGGTALRDEVVGIDLPNRTVQLRSGRALGYDLISFNVGSECAQPCAVDRRADVWPVKPLRKLWELRQYVQKRCQEPRVKPLNITVVGGGASGCEVAASLCSLRTALNARVKLRLVHSGSRLLPSLPEGAARRVQSALEARGIILELKTRVTEVQEGFVTLGDGSTLPSDITVLAAGLTSPRFLRDLGIAGPLGIPVADTLQSVAHPALFAVGDCAAFAAHPLERIGAHTLHQAQLLGRNLMAAAREETLENFVPARHPVQCLNLGSGEGLLVCGSLYWYGRSAFFWKKVLDSLWMARMQSQPLLGGAEPMEEPDWTLRTNWALRMTMKSFGKSVRSLKKPDQEPVLAALGLRPSRAV